ncbi:molecular chaperone DnaJ [Acinetobacter lanii]|uniref:Molecular chaperone DnaJ n=1 Tax=Acinetobacter lanii TaxID=2715163 RepID=A0A6G8S5X6_9GAMM|nr:molecular chaperone DnaJ [Acinetobacter lanii]QIO09557.1 molecular chaperone DnaJ [Acinetobacter lanii]
MSYLIQKTPQAHVDGSPQQLKLNRLIEQIEQKKCDLLAWENAKNELHQHARKTLIPTYYQLHQVLFQQLEQLWMHLGQGHFSKADIAQLDAKLMLLSAELKDAQALSDADLNRVKEVYQFYQQHIQHQQKAKREVGNQRDVDQQESDSTTSSLHSNEFDPALTDADLNESAYSNEREYDWEHIEWNAFEKNTEQHQQAREQAKLKKQQEKREQAEKLVNQSLKTVYLKIAASIHPDREQNEAKKIEKTAVLQQANEAYEQQDLFSLLKLQIQIESNASSGESSLSHTKKGLSNEQVKFYQLALEAQGQRLDDQINQIIESLIWVKPVKADKPKKFKNKPSAQLQVVDIYKQIDTDTAHMKQQVKAEKERLKYMQRLSGLEMLLEHQAL